MNSRLILYAISVLLSVAVPSSAVVLEQTDTFEDGTTQGWTAGIGGFGSSPVPPSNVDTGGPQGTDDSYLLLRSIGGGGPGSRFSAINMAQWTGDFTAAGISSIEMDVRNFGETDLALRLLFVDIAPNAPPENIAFSADAILVPAGGQWTHISFPIRAPDLLTALGNVNDALAHTTEFRIYHSPDPVAPAPSLNLTPSIVASLGVDNIQATVPDGGSTALLLAAAAAGLIRKGKQHR